MPWLESHEPWIDWRSKEIGSSNPGRNEAQVRHEPSFVHRLEASNPSNPGDTACFAGAIEVTASARGAVVPGRNLVDSSRKPLRSALRMGTARRRRDQRGGDPGVSRAPRHRCRVRSASGPFHCRVISTARGVGTRDVGRDVHGRACELSPNRTDRRGGAKKLSSMDMVDGYYQVLMEPFDVSKTAVSTPSGMLWEWLAMLQGLSNAPATFNRLVTHLFRPLRAFAQTYFDDIYVLTKPEHGRDLDDLHEEHLRQVLECLKEHQLYANLDKCIFVSDYAIGCALVQADEHGGDRVVSYQSRQLQAAEKNYPVHEKELLAMNYALVKFRVHLLGALPFVVYTDHASLRTATQSPHLSRRMARWLSFFSEYNFKVEYKPGRLNVLADALSRRPDYEIIHLTSINSDVYDLIRDAYLEDSSCSAITAALSSPTPPASLASRIRARLHRYRIQEGLLMYQVAAGDPDRVVVCHDDDLRYVIAYGVHDAPGAGHLGREQTYALLYQRFWWPKMYKWVLRCVRSFEICTRVTPGLHSQAPLQSLPVPSDCWKSISLDFFFNLPPTSAGHNGVLVIVDRLS